MPGAVEIQRNTIMFRFKNGLQWHHHAWPKAKTGQPLILEFKGEYRSVECMLAIYKAIIKEFEFDVTMRAVYHIVNRAVVTSKKQWGAIV